MKAFENKIKKTIEDNKLCSKKEKVLVAVSGGKDSITTLYLLKKFGYNVEAMIIDLLIGDWSKKHSINVKEFCKKEEIKLHIVDLRKEFGASMCFFKSGIQKKAKLSNCMICGIIKRWLLNKKARDFKADKLATGHNLDDEAETIMMNLFKGNLQLMAGMGPEPGIVKNKKFIPRIKPLYWCLNSEVKKYSELKKFPVIYDDCPCLVDSFRKRVRDNLTETEKENPKVKFNIVKSFQKVLPEIKKEYQQKKSTMKYCEACREPSRNQICKMCELLKVIK